MPTSVYDASLLSVRSRSSLRALVIKLLTLATLVTSVPNFSSRSVVTRGAFEQGCTSALLPMLSPSNPTGPVGYGDECRL